MRQKITRKVNGYFDRLGYEIRLVCDGSETSPIYVNGNIKNGSAARVRMDNPKAMPPPEIRHCCRAAVNAWVIELEDFGVTAGEVKERNT